MEKSRKFILSLIQNKVINNKTDNLNRIKDLVEKSISIYNSQVIVLPEFCTTPTKGYVEKFAEEESNSETLQFFSKLSKDNNIYLIGGSIPILDNNKYYNSCYCFNNKGEIQARYRKNHLFDIDIPGKMTNFESDTIAPGNDFTVFDTPYCKFGIGICYDIR